MTDVVCELRRVSKSYDGRAVINNFDLSVERGEMLAITGKSGSGKSTLLNIMGLLEPVDAGELRLFQEKNPRVGSAAATKLRRHELGYLFQNFALVDGETVESNLKIAQAYAKDGRSVQAERRRSALAAVGLAGAERRKVYELSGGEQQRVAIARLMLKPCELVLADEPTGSLDVATADVVIDLLHKLNAAGKTVIVVTHDERVASTCQRIISLDHTGTTRQEASRGSIK